MNRAKRVFKTAIALLAATLSIGLASEALIRQRVAAKFPAPGRLVDIGGRRIQIDCRGSGSPTVVLESGLDMLGSLSWATVHDSIAKTTRVCAYSRAGIMWSDPSSAPFSSGSVARDLRAALRSAGERAPFIMVGHSLGGPYVTVFTRLYPSEVAGLVLVDASHPDQVARMERATGVSMTPPTGALAFAANIARTGALRFVPSDFAQPNAPTVVHEAPAALAVTSLAALLQETRALHSTFATAGEFRQLGDRPLIVLTAMAPLSPEMLAAQHMNREQESSKQAAWKALQQDESTWSRRGRQILVPDATHYIQFDRPDVVIAAVRDVVCAVRIGRPACRS